MTLPAWEVERPTGIDKASWAKLATQLQEQLLKVVNSFTALVKSVRERQQPPRVTRGRNVRDEEVKSRRRIAHRGRREQVPVARVTE